MGHGGLLDGRGDLRGGLGHRGSDVVLATDERDVGLLRQRPFLDGVTDLGHGSDSPGRVVTDRSLPGEHDGVGPAHDGMGHVGHFGERHPIIAGDFDGTVVGGSAVQHPR